MRQVVSVIEDETVFWGLTRSQRFEINSFLSCTESYCEDSVQAPGMNLNLCLFYDH